MNATSVDIADFLEEYSSFGLSIGTNLFVGKEPHAPIDTVTIFDTPGFPPQLTLDEDNNDYYFPSIQIRIKNKDYRTGMDLANDIKEYLHSKNNETINDTKYILIQSTGDPLLLDWDEGNKFCRIVINFNIQRRA